MGEIISLSKLPTLPELKHIPKAKPNSFFLNHSIIKANWAVFKFSPPIENSIFPYIF